MLLAVPTENLGEVLQIFEDEQVETTVLGQYNSTGEATLYHHGTKIAQLELEALFNPPKLERSTSWTPPTREEPEIPEPEDLGAVLLKLLAAYNIVSKEKVVRRYDQEVKGQTVVKPLQGWKAGPNNGAVLKPLDDSWKGIAISSGINPRYGQIDPYWMAAAAIDEAVRNNVAVGGRRISLLDNFTWGNPEYEDRLGGLVYACRACYDVGKAYGTPFVSGKDSLYNESPLGPVTPTLLVTALGIVPDIRKAVTMDLKEAGNFVYLIGETKPELGGSEYYHLNRHLGASVPKLDTEKSIAAYRRLTEAMDAGYVRACHDLSEGGLAVSAAEMAFTGDLGMDLDLSRVPTSEEMRDDFILFSESCGRLLVEVTPEHKDAFETVMAGSTIAKVGEVKGETKLTVRKGGAIIVELPLEELIGAWKTPLEVPR
ncbi:Phosphoribosylformylglycinamidine synthase subunit PurL [subsurface metagenome]